MRKLQLLPTELTEMKNCVICTQEIPKALGNRAVTCSKPCSEEHNRRSARERGRRRAGPRKDAMGELPPVSRDERQLMYETWLDMMVPDEIHVALVFQDAQRQGYGLNMMRRQASL